MTPEYKIRRMREQEIRIALDFASAEGWNPGQHDDISFYKADSDGFFVGLLDEVPISCISAVSYKDFGFIGLYIVKAGYRGMGYGLKIFQAAMKHLNGKNIGLDAVDAQVENYKRSGFRPHYRNCRYLMRSHKSKNQKSIIAVAGIPIEKVMLYDRTVFLSDRKEFLASWISQPERHALAYIEDGKIAGYGVIRQCVEGYKIGPLFSDSPAIAQCLLNALLDSVPINSPVYIDMPLINEEAMNLADRRNMSKIFETSRMYTGDLPQAPFGKIFGVTTLEIG